MLGAGRTRGITLSFRIRTSIGFTLSEGGNAVGWSVGKMMRWLEGNRHRRMKLRAVLVLKILRT